MNKNTKPQCSKLYPHTLRHLHKHTANWLVSLNPFPATVYVKCYDLL